VYPLIRVRLCLIILFLYISLESYNEKQFYVEIYVLAVFKMTIYIGNITDHDDYYTSDYTGTEQTVLATILMFIIIFSLYGNGGMIIVLYKNDRMWNSTNILIGNLAVVAALTTLLIMPFSLTSMILQRWPFADGPICKFNAFLASQLLLYTIFIHTMISIDRQVFRGCETLQSCNDGAADLADQFRSVDYCQLHVSWSTYPHRRIPVQ